MQVKLLLYMGWGTTLRNRIIILIIWILVISMPAYAENIIFMDRFNEDLSAWIEDETGGIISIMTVNYSPKMTLSDTSGSQLISATRSYSEPTELYIVEFDMKITSDGNVLKAQLLSTADSIIAEIDLGSTNDTASFDTDNATASTVSWSNNIYKQVIFVVDVLNNDIACYVSQDDNTYGSLQIVGAAKSYSGTAITKIRFTTNDSATTTGYVDEVRVYIPDIAIIGDSISDGKSLWSTHPEYPAGRMGSSEDETSSPSYQLALLIDSNTWVGNRGFGGSRLDGGTYPSVDDYIQSSVIDQGFKKVIISAGHNDIMNSDTLAIMQTDLNSIISRLQSGGITGSNICLCTIAPSGYIDTSGERAVLDSYNDWVVTRATEIGAVVADNYTALKSSGDPYALNAAYNGGDNTHLNKTGSGVMAQTIYNSRYWKFGYLIMGLSGNINLGSGATINLQ